MNKRFLFALVTTLLVGGSALAQAQSDSRTVQNDTAQMETPTKKKAPKKKKKPVRSSSNSVGPTTPTDGVAGKPSSPVPGPGSNEKSRGNAATPTTPTDGVAGSGKTTSTPKSSAARSTGAPTSGERTDGVAAPSPSPSPGSR